MLSNPSLKRLNFAFTLLCVFAIIPCDWDGKIRRLTRTRYWFRIWLNHLVVFGPLAALLYFQVCFVMEVLLGNFTLIQTLIIGMYFGVALLVVSVINGIKLYGDELIYIINNVYIVDKLVQG